MARLKRKAVSVPKADERADCVHWPWVQVLRTYVEQQEPQDLRSQLGAVGPDIAQIVPEVTQKLPDASVSLSQDDPETARFRLPDKQSR